MFYGLVRSLIMIFQNTRPRLRILASPVFLLCFFGFSYTAMHILAWALIRYRLPVDAILISFAGLAVFDVAGWLTAKFGRKGWLDLQSSQERPRSKSLNL
jgi:hypothetical protein